MTIAPEPTCRKCGCSQNRACVTENGTCYWVEPDLCSTCAGAPAHPMALAIAAASQATESAAELLRFGREGDQNLHGGPFEGDVVEQLLDAAKMAMEIEGWNLEKSPGRPAYEAVVRIIEGWA